MNMPTISPSHLKSGDRIDIWQRSVPRHVGGETRGEVNGGAGGGGRAAAAVPATDSANAADLLVLRRRVVLVAAACAARVQSEPLQCRRGLRLLGQLGRQRRVRRLLLRSKREWMLR